MKTSRNLGLAAIVAFVISFFLPAYGKASGFACFGTCWDMLWESARTGIDTDGWFPKLYYSGFVISNILFIGLSAALVITQKRRKLSSVLSVMVCLHVLSWVVLSISSGKSSQVAEIKIGYYVWLMAYALLVAANLRAPAAARKESRTATSPDKGGRPFHDTQDFEQGMSRQDLADLIRT
jgi:hypothetical protein